MRIGLINSNRIRPPIAPIGLDYVAEALATEGHQVDVLDLCWADDWGQALDAYLAHAEYGLLGLTLRNTDDCTYASRHSFLGEFAAMVARARRGSAAPIVVGGVGFSTMPEQVLDLCAADLGVWGDGEFALAELARRMERHEDWRGVPNLLWQQEDGHWRRNPPASWPLDQLPPMTRTWLDNPRYFHEGGQAGFETKRGCGGRCIYCADPVAKGQATRVRPPAAVAEECGALLGLGIDHLHTCDSEFNLPPRHAAAVCQELTRRGLGERLRWYAYCAPAPFSADLAGEMRRAGCVGINFGADSGDARMLRRLGRGYGPEEILGAIHACHDVGITVMIDLLLGAPGENRESIARTITLMQRAAPERVGISLGVRVYPGTPLAEMLRAGPREGLSGGDDPATPLFFLEPQVAPYAGELLDQLIGDDPRFLFLNPANPERNYSYNANQRLVEAIAQGYRGAYWDILRRFSP